MNTELTPTEQERVKNAARKYATKMSAAPDKETPDWIEQDFKAGASYYEKEVMPGKLAKAMEWVSLKGLYQEIDGRWYDKFGGKVRMVAETTQDLLILFEKYTQTP